MSAQASNLNPDRYLNIKDVMAVVSVSRSTVYDWIQKGQFPAARELGPNCVRWRESEVMAWMNSRPVAQTAHA